MLHDLGQFLLPQYSPFEIIIRGTITYLAIFLLLRLIVKQAAGALNLADLLLIVLIADASQNAMAGDYTSVGDGVILVLTLTFWNLALDWLSFHFQAFGNWTHPPPVKLVENGMLNRQNMQKELVSFEELMTYVRQQGGDSLEDVKAAWVEGSGQVSVHLFKPEDKQDQPDRRAAGAA